VVFKKISHRSISSEIIAQIEDLLKRGELKPGDVLPSERELVDLMGVSRAPLREALKVLEAMGFIEIRPRSKIIIKSAIKRPVEDPLGILIAEDNDKIFELLEIRREMECWAAGKAAQRATEGAIEKLREIVQKDNESSRNTREKPKTDLDFHVAISMAANNIIQSHLVASVYNLFWNSQRLLLDRIYSKKGNRQLIAEQHQRIFESIRDRDSKRASEEIRRHIDFAENELKHLILE